MFTEAGGTASFEGRMEGLKYPPELPMGKKRHLIEDRVSFVKKGKGYIGLKSSVSGKQQ